VHIDACYHAKGLIETQSFNENSRRRNYKVGTFLRVQDENSVTTSTKENDHPICSFNEFFIEICLSIDLFNDILFLILHVYLYCLCQRQ
jgi:hypothetical protein